MMEIATTLDQKNHHSRPRREHIYFHRALMTYHDHTKLDLPVSCSIHDEMVQGLLIDSKSQERVSHLYVFFSHPYGFFSVSVIFGASYEGSPIISVIGKYSAAFENSSGDVIVRRTDFTSRKTLFLIVPPTPSIFN